MSEMMWNLVAGEKFTNFVVAQDMRFQAAMRDELRCMAADRGLILRDSPKLPSPVVTKREQGLPRRSGHARDFMMVSEIMPSRGGIWKTFHHEQIIRDCAAKHNVSINELIGARREKAMVKARFEAYHRMSDELGYSLPMIGKACGGKDHTSVLHGIRKHRKGLEQSSMEKAA